MALASIAPRRSDEGDTFVLEGVQRQHRETGRRSGKPRFAVRRNAHEIPIARIHLPKFNKDRASRFAEWLVFRADRTALLETERFGSNILHTLSDSDIELVVIMAHGNLRSALDICDTNFCIALPESPLEATSPTMQRITGVLRFTEFSLLEVVKLLSVHP